MEFGLYCSLLLLAGWTASPSFHALRWRMDSSDLGPILTPAAETAETPVSAECCCPTDHENWKTGAYHTSSQRAALVTSSTAHWLQASCSCVQGVTRPATTVPGWRLFALDRHRPPITAIGYDVLTCATTRTRTHLRDRSFSVAGPCLWNSLPVTLRDRNLHLYSLRDFWRHCGLSMAAAHSDCCFFAPCTNILTYLLTYLHGSVGSHESVSKWLLDQFSRFCSSRVHVGVKWHTGFLYVPDVVCHASPEVNVKQWVQLMTWPRAFFIYHRALEGIVIGSFTPALQCQYHTWIQFIRSWLKKSFGRTMSVPEIWSVLDLIGVECRRSGVWSPPLESRCKVPHSFPRSWNTKMCTALFLPIIDGYFAEMNATYFAEFDAIEVHWFYFSRFLFVNCHRSVVCRVELTFADDVVKFWRAAGLWETDPEVPMQRLVWRHWARSRLHVRITASESFGH